ncbi:MAG: NfeD family protein [Candidatus Riflebacteria bacterium]|nr:NfeD family protein [Candidatus Riflebacteria bacterium]
MNTMRSVMMSYHNRFFSFSRLTLAGVILLIPILVTLCHAQNFSDGELIPKKASESVAETYVTDTASFTHSGAPIAAKNDESEELPIGMIVGGLLLTGLILLFVEVTLIPGFGVPAIIGIIAILAGMCLAFWKLSTQAAILYTMTSVGALVVIVFWTLYVFPYTTFGKKFVLNTKISIEDGYTAVQDFSELVGQEGIASSDLRPSGIANICGRRIDVVSEGDFIPRGTKIRVVRQKNNNLVVIAI